MTKRLTAENAETQKKILVFVVAARRARRACCARDTGGTPTIAVIRRAPPVFWQSIHAGAEKAARLA